ncbi:MAG: tRNA epoxyqueuosine(34) reductase QueG [Halanaerobiales bacterium]
MCNNRSIKKELEQMMNISNKERITELIKNKAKEIGFDLVGITSAEPFQQAYSILEKRKLTEFISNDRELLTNPASHLASAKSIIALALSYASKRAGKEEEQNIALYARGKDYHQVMQEKMNELIIFIKTLATDAETITYSDTGVLLDREVAYRAGLGWIGKSNNLINPEYGSYLMLGEILTNLPLVTDQAMESRCGTCQLCIDNCPTQALKAYCLEPELCLSYISQKKDPLSMEEREMLGNQLWGCDRCLEVCPYNRDIPYDLHPEFFPVLKGDIKTILNFTNHNIPGEWKEAALFWRGLRTLKRNTIINIGNLGKEEYLPLLIDNLANPSPVLRAYTVWSLGKYRKEEIKALLSNHYFKENDNMVKKEIEKIFQNNNWGDIND